MTEAASSILDLEAMGEDVEWTDVAAAADARNRGRAEGRLAELVSWLAATQGGFPPRLPQRPRCVVFGPVPDGLPDLATSLGVGLQSIGVDPDASVGDAVEFGTAIADDEADSGTDLVVAADPDVSPAAGVLVGLLTGAEPVSLLPRGAQATDTAAWIERAEYLRDARRRIGGMRGSPDDLLTALGSPTLATTVAFVLRSAARRTPMVLDGTSAAVAALFATDIQSRVSGWVQLADTAPDPVHARAALDLDLRPLLDLGLTGGEGTAGLLAVTVLRAAALTAAPTSRDPGA